MFKVGDRVKYVGGSKIYVSWDWMGLCGTVTGFVRADGEEIVQVKFDRKNYGNLAMGNGCYISNLRKIYSCPKSKVIRA